MATIRSRRARPRRREHSHAIAARARFSRRLGVALPLEILRERFVLAPVDIEILGALATIERGTAFNPYTIGKNEPLQADVAFLVALLANGDTMLPGEVRLRFSADAPLVSRGLVELSAANGGRSIRRSSTSACASPIACSITSKARRSQRRRSSARSRDSRATDARDRCAVTRAGADRSGRLARCRVPIKSSILTGAPGVGRKSIAGAAARADRPADAGDRHDRAARSSSAVSISR